MCILSTVIEPNSGHDYALRYRAIKIRLHQLVSEAKNGRTAQAKVEEFTIVQSTGSSHFRDLSNVTTQEIVPWYNHQQIKVYPVIPRAAFTSVSLFFCMLPHAHLFYLNIHPSLIGCTISQSSDLTCSSAPFYPKVSSPGR